MSQDKPIPVVAVLGPTASGKSALAESLAEQVESELINSDASAVYRELSVGVTKPDLATRERYRYHLLDVATLEQGFDLNAYLESANRVLKEVWARGNLPIVVGGSGLYARALLDGYAPPQIEVSQQVREWARSLEPEAALAELVALDPEAYQRIDRQNPRRVTRALELARQAGGPVPPPIRTGRPDLRILRFYLQPERELLNRRIEQRTQSMWRGWTEEVLSLEKKGLARWLELRKPIGYAEVLAFNRGQLSCEEAMQRIVSQTRKLAKKQRTWLKREAEHPLSFHFAYARDEQWGAIPEQAHKALLEFLN